MHLGLLSVPYESSGSAPLRFPHQVAHLFLGAGVFTGCDLATVVELADDGLGSPLWVIEGERGRASGELHECDLKASNQQEGGNV
jgi:hypothetical protein